MTTAPLPTLASRLQELLTELALDAQLQPQRLRVQQLPLQAANGRICAADVHAPLPVPGFRASAMDGFAVASTDPVFQGAPPFELQVQGVAAAGRPFSDGLAHNQAVRIFTGAMLPERADAIVIQENTEGSAGSQIRMLERPVAGDHIRDVGDDMSAGDLLLRAGTRLDILQLAQLAACGISTVPVWRPLQVGVFATGDELREPGSQLASGQIFESNRMLLQGLLRSAPIAWRDLGILPDNPAQIGSALTTAATDLDVLITSGGVSVGDTDHVRDVVQEIGQLQFWKLAIKPGKPVAYGRINQCLFFGLPGNPVSAAVTALLLVKPVLVQLAGGSYQAPLRINAHTQQPIQHQPGRTEYLRGHYWQDQAGLHVAPAGAQGSNRLRSLAEANCLIEIPADLGDLAAASQVQILPFYGLLQ